MNPAIVELINLGLAQAIALWKALKQSDPSAPTLTDAQIIELLGTDADAIVAKGQQWLSTHPQV